jgi:NAD(P)-dependent dehydrogenase (short-subunit alcohol dehydrogenase family)
MSALPPSRAIVITGCSSGFGRVTALHLARHGWFVFATVRSETDQSDLLSEATRLGCKEQLAVIICDITQLEQVVALSETVAAETTRLHALLNNAGTAYAAPLELLALDDLRAQLEINVVAQVSITQALLPLLKEARGTIINVSSVSGRIATPVIGAYAASKFALEAISDTWRIELAHFGVRVVVIEPDSSSTNIWDTSRQRSAARLGAYRDGPYRRLLNTTESIVARIPSAGFPPQLFADTILHILSASRPHARYVVPRKAIWLLRLHRLLPDSIWDKQIRRMMRW